MRVRCPHCHNPIEVVADDPLIDMECPSCGSHFGLITGQSTATYRQKTRKIADFELLDQVGQGKFGTVWKADDTKLDRIVAIKIPRTEQFDQGEMELFLREMRAAAQVKHRSIISVHEVGRDMQNPYIVSEFVEGANLKEWMNVQAHIQRSGGIVLNGRRMRGLQPTRRESSIETSNPRTS